MSEVVTALHRFDLPVAQGLAAQRGARVFLADPALHGRALAAGVVDPLVHTRSAADISRLAYREAQQSTQALCRDLGAQLVALAPKAVEGCWSGHRISQLFLTLHGYRRIWADILAQHTHAHWHVLLPQQAHTYGTHSFAPGLQLLNQLRERGVPFGAYGYDCPGMDAYQLPDLRQIAPDTELLVHLPTCRYDAAHFAAEIQASGLRAGVLTAQVYDEPLPGLPASGLVPLTGVRELLEAHQLARVQALEPGLRAVLAAHLHPHIQQARFLELQVQALWEALEAQALLYVWLEQHFRQRCPRQLLISNHDATMHGALTSFALQSGAALTVVPHSRVHNQTLKLAATRPLCLHHGLQDGPSLDIAGQALPAGLLAYPEPEPESQAPGPLRTLGVVLNGISSNGMCCVHFERYVEGLRELRDWSRQAGVVLKLRVRMAETPVALLVERLGLDMDELMQLAQGSLLDFARSCDCCVGYDMPTSGLQDLVQQGLAVMQAEVRPLGWSEWSIVDERVVPRHGLPELMDRLALLKSSEAEFRRFRERQHRRAREAQDGAKALSSWLLEQQAGVS